MLGLPSRLGLLTTLGIAAGIAGPACSMAQQARDPVEAAVETITPESVRGHIAVLAHDQLRGRDTPSDGLEIAARYIADLHESYGLEPAGTDGTFYQRYPFGLYGPYPTNSEITLIGPGGTAELAPGTDLFLDGGSDDPLDTPLVYVDVAAGTKLAAGSLVGSTAMFLLSGSWGQDMWESSLAQAQIARAAGAAAVVHILDSSFPRSVVGQLGSALSQPRWQLGGDAFLPRLFIRKDAIEQVIPDDSRPWDHAEPTGGDGDALVRVLTGAELHARVPLNMEDGGTPANVLAEVPASDPELRDEYIVLTAHFDHVGVGEAVDGDSIYNGADDNASGTAALLEVARVLGGLPPDQRPSRTVLFAHVSGEEKGLLGSEWWVTHPTRPIDNVIANLNIDMIGGDTHPDTLAVLGNEYSSLGPLIMGLNEAHPELRLSTVSDLWPQEQLFFRSDQLNFMKKEIPSLFLFAGLHRCYHRPCDELDFVNTDKIARVARLLTYTVLEIANQPGRPEWDPAGLSEVRRLTSGVR